MKRIDINFRVIILSLLFEFNSADPSHFECGPHGRFEYCVDEIPDCVIGCHCHPGYYFDTDTKICEPNTKLTKDYRRYYASEPTRIPLFQQTQHSLGEATPSPTNAIDEAVDAITNDADDLGDWLYNQFFKTIENQVINKTEHDQLTRKSGSNINTKQYKQKRKRNSRRRSSSKRRKSKSALKRKLLRITEDDSLFDSSSSESSDESSSSTESETESESESSKEKKDNKDHGHRRIIMYNKKPTPPLPSFIFLPNLETSYYPPLGLPPPPVVPMYPMVPIPPVYAGGVKCDEDGQSGNKTTESPQENHTTTFSTATVATTVTTESVAEVTDITEPDQPPDNTPNPAGRMGKNLRKGGKHSGILQRLRDKMQRRHKRPPQRPMKEQTDLPEAPFLDESLIQEFLNSYHGPFPPRPEFEEPKTEDVNFKYLTELIHRPTLNESNKLDDRLKPPFGNIMGPPPLHRKMNTALNLNQGDMLQNKKTVSVTNIDGGDSSYYTRLGREIASLIRKFDGKSDTNAEIEPTKLNKQSSSVINENQFAPRSYWERSVRSALHNYNRYFNTKENYMLDSNDKLVSLEEQVNFAATTKSTLTLQQLENMVHFMQNTKSQKKKLRQIHHLKQPTQAKSLNINLLPPERNKQADLVVYRRMPNPTMTNTNIHRNNLLNSPMMYVAPIAVNEPPKQRENNQQKINKPKINDTDHVKNETLKKNNVKPTLPQMVKEESIKNPLLYFWRKSQATPLHYQVSKIINKNIPSIKGSSRPLVSKYKQWNANNHNHFENAYHPPRHMNPKRINKPTSYFHHEIQHLDYFD